MIALASIAAAAGLTGCGVGPAALEGPGNPAAVSGTLHGGQQPVTGSNVYLYATSAGAYGTGAVLLGHTTSLASGFFTFNGTTLASCPTDATSQAYLLSAGGNPGLSIPQGGPTPDNPGIMMMAAIGPCSGLSSGTFVNMNELTTVIAAYALAGFLPAGGAGITESALSSNNLTIGVGTKTTNTQGLVDAFLNANNIQDLANGNPLTVPLANSSGVVPASTIISLANALSACVNTSGATTAGTGCGSLYAAATPPTGSGISAPANILQAILNIAAFPGNNVSGVFGVTPPITAFGGGLSTAPNDWTIGITYTSTNLVAPAGLAIDKTDNVYAVGYPTTPAAAVALLEFSPQGGLLSPAAGWNSSATVVGTAIKSSDNVRALAIDPSGNVFLSDGNVAQIFEYAPAGTAKLPTAGTISSIGYTTASTNKNNWGIAADASGNIWSATYKQNTCASSGSSLCSFVEFPAPSFTPTITIGSGAVTTVFSSGPRGVAADAGSTSTKGNIWASSNNDSNVVIVNSATGAATPVTVSSNACAFTYGVALDASGNGWVTGAGNTLGTGSTGTTCATTSPSQLYKVTASGTVTTLGTSTTVAANGSTNGTPFSTAFYDAVDGAGNIFVTNSLIIGTTAPAASTIAEYSPSFNSAAGALLSNNLGFSPGATYSGGALSGGVVQNARSIAIDRSGAMWVLNPGTAGSLVQILGVAAPTNPVLSTGGYGAKP